jgi:citrate lyase beta subunit
MDVQHGMIGKTAIHPLQIPIIEAAYQVQSDDLKAARAILDPNAQAVFRIGDQMCEPATHQKWAKRILAQAQIYGEVPSPINGEVPSPINGEVPSPINLHSIKNAA